MCFLLICGVTPAFIAVLYGGIFLFTALYLAVDYLVLKRRLAQLENLLASLPERYLAGEVLPVPAGGVERCYYRVMKVFPPRPLTRRRRPDGRKRNIWSMWSGGSMS